MTLHSELLSGPIGFQWYTITVVNCESLVDRWLQPEEKKRVAHLGGFGFSRNTGTTPTSGNLRGAHNGRTGSINLSPFP